MQTRAWPPRWPLALTVALTSSLSACGGGGDGAAIEARPQAISASATTQAALTVNSRTTITAIASSGLAVSYRSSTPAVCSVDASSGEVTTLAQGTCRIVLSQSGDEHYAPAVSVTLLLTIAADPHQTLSFGPAPVLTLGGTATVQATASSGLPVHYRSDSPSVCNVDELSGLVTALSPGDCLVAANQAGNAEIQPAAQVLQTLSVSVPGALSVPEAAQGVTATAGESMHTVVVKAASVASGGSPITHYTVASLPAGISFDSTSLPATVSCPGSCAGYSFTVTAHNALGAGPATAGAHVVTRYNVTTTFYEPDTQPRNTIFRGSFVFDATTGAVSQLSGTLSESMTGDNSANDQPDYLMTQLPLNHQLSAVRDATLGGVLATTFLNSDTHTFSTFVGGDGWSPASGVDAGGLYYGYPSKQTGITNPGNAYAMIFVNTSDPTIPLTQAQIDKLAYADCAPGGMMGFACMTGTSVAGYGSVGTMSGYPLSQLITRQTD
jgi:hypothetical protein